MSLIEKLKAGKNNIKTVSWPGTDEKVGIVVLTEAERQDAQFAVEALFKQRNIEYSSSTVEAYNVEHNTQILARALVFPDKRDTKGNPVRIFASADELRPLLQHPDAKDRLIQEYLDWQEECSPAFENITEQQYQTMFDEVKKNPSFLNASNSRTLRGLIIYLAKRATELQMVSGSTS